MLLHRCQQPASEVRLCPYYQYLDHAKPGRCLLRHSHLPAQLSPLHRIVPRKDAGGVSTADAAGSTHVAGQIRFLYLRALDAPSQARFGKGQQGGAHFAQGIRRREIGRGHFAPGIGSCCRTAPHHAPQIDAALLQMRRLRHEAQPDGRLQSRVSEERTFKKRLRHHERPAEKASLEICLRLQ